MVHVFVDTFEGLDSLSFRYDGAKDLKSLREAIGERVPPSIWPKLLLRQKGGAAVTDQVFDNEFINLRLSWPLCGGKGGFGNQLKAEGGRMAKKRKGPRREEDEDSFRTVDGQRYKNVREAKLVAKYVIEKPENDKKKREDKKKKLQALVDQASDGWQSKASLDDAEYIEQSEDLMSDIRRATEQSRILVRPSSGTSSGSASGSSNSSKAKSKAAGFFDDDDDDDEEDEEESDKN